MATDAPNHAKHCIDVLKHGKHVANTLQTHGMAKAWQKHVNNIANTLQTQGMAKTWQRHGNKHGEGTVMRVRHIRVGVRM